MTADRKLVALVACGDQLYRRYLLEQLNEAYYVWLLTNEQLSWQRPFICGSTQIPDYTPNSLEKAIVDIQKTREVSGIVCWDERYIIAAADTAVLFELPSAGSLGIRGCRDKALCRTRLSEAGVLQPRSKHCLTLDAAVEFARSLPYPLVVKPRGMGGSIGVALVQDEAALQTRFDEASKASLQGAVDFHYGALIEEFVEGPEISIDACVVDGVYTPLFIAHKSVGLP